MASGHVVFYREGSLFAAPLDAEHIRPTGPEVHVIDGVRQWNEVPQFDISQNGVLVYRTDECFSGANPSQHRDPARDNRVGARLREALSQISVAGFPAAIPIAI